MNYDKAETRKEVAMRRIVLSLAALAALTLVVPYDAPAKADTVVIHRHHHHHRHMMPHHDHKTVIIKHDHD